VGDGGGIDQLVLCRCEQRLYSVAPCPKRKQTYWNLLLGKDHGAVFSPKANRHDVRGGDRFECIFCCGTASALSKWVAYKVAYQLDTGGPVPKRW
jgi:hypothetical protein